MFSARRPRAALLALLLAVLASAAGVGASPSIASAASPHRAAVIVDTGSGVHKVVITFNEDSISGIDALQRAGANPVVYSFNGQGGAICRLFGVGRDSGPNCLGGQDGDNRYWAYFRAPAGTSSFKYSSIGAGTARVRDGDVEGWKFATGAAPAYVSLASLTPPPPPPPSTSPATKPAGSVTPGGSAPGAAVAPSATGPTSASTLPTTGGAAPTPGVTGATGKAGAAARSNAAGTGAKQSDKTAQRATDDGKAVDTALTSSGQDNRGSSAWSLLLFAGLIAAIVAAIFLVRRVRKQHA